MLVEWIYPTRERVLVTEFYGGGERKSELFENFKDRNQLEIF